MSKDYQWGPHLGTVSMMGLVGLVVSIVLLSDYYDQVLKIVELMMKSLFG